MALPNELWLRILGYLKKSDLKTIRLSGERHLGLLAASLLFDTTYVAARRGVLDSFTALTSHPVLLHFVKKVVFDSSYIDPIRESCWRKSSSSPHMTAFFEEQEQIQKHELSDQVEAAFERLRNVQRVHYADLSRMSYLPGDQNEASKWCEYADGPLFLRRETSELHNLVGGACPNRLQAEGCSLHEDFGRQHRSFLILLRALAKHASPTMIDLSLGDNLYSSGDGYNDHGGIAHQFFSPGPSGELLNDFASVLHRLRKLNICIAPTNATLENRYGRRSFGGWHRRKEGLTMDLTKVLSYAAQLEELTLVGGPGTGYLCFAHTLGSNTWKKLHTLGLRYFEAANNDLEALFSRHATSLRYVTISQCNLVGGKWRSLRDNIHTTLPKLELILGIVFHDAIMEKHCEGYLPEGASSIQFAELQEEIEPRMSGEDMVLEDDLEDSSDDSSSETENEPRRVPGFDIALLDMMDTELLAKVERLRDDLAGCSVTECLKALISEGGKTLDAKRELMARFGYTGREHLEPEMRAMVKRLQKQSDCDVDEAVEALELYDYNFEEALDWLLQISSASESSSVDSDELW